MDQPIIEQQQQQQQPSPIDMMTGPQPPQQAYAPVQPYPNQPYPAQPYPSQPYAAQPYPQPAISSPALPQPAPCYMPGQPVLQVYPQGQQQQLYGGYPVVLQAAYVQMPPACPAGAPVSVKEGATKDTAHMPYMLSLLCITGVLLPHRLCRRRNRHRQGSTHWEPFGGVWHLHGIFDRVCLSRPFLNDRI